MHPELFSIGPISVKTYGFCMALGFLAAWKTLEMLCRRSGRRPEAFSNLVVYLIVGGVLGSRVAYVIEHWSAEFAAHPLDVVKVWQGGLMFYGGLLLDLAVFFAWCLARREKMLEAADLLAAVIPLGHAFGRVGCFFYGCCYGRQVQSVWAVAFPRGSPAWHEQAQAGLIPWSAAESLPVLPTQLVEAAAVLALFAVTLAAFRRFHAALPGFTTGCYLAGYAVVRFCMEFLRGDPRAVMWGLSIGQVLSLLIFSAGLAFMAVAFRRKKS